jgi:hypothetical protein
VSIHHTTLPCLLPIQRAAVLVLDDAGFKKVLFFLEVHRFRHPPERIWSRELKAGASFAARFADEPIVLVRPQPGPVFALARTAARTGRYRSRRARSRGEVR